ncbi:MAG TPA: hypothetical protein VE953_13065 [Terriglobales bacterium]|nr:hypothetical protein [Terriglobales bacterium]
MTQAPPPQQGLVSPDGHWRWDGTQWVPNQPAQLYPSPPPVTRSAPADTAPAPQPAWSPPPSPLAPTSTALAAPAALGLAYQFSGDAMWSIIFGVASIGVPLFTPIYFPILPIFGIWRGVLAVRRRRVLGGVIGLVVSAIGCLFSLLYSGLLNSLLR